MKVLRNQTIYKCDYCTMVSRSSAAMYSHELSCKNNPHNHVICLGCSHCEAEEIKGNSFSKCERCPESKYPKSDMARMFICEGCHGYGADVLTHEVYRCAISGKLMYHPSVLRLRKGEKRDIMSKCDRAMLSEADGCDDFEPKN